MKKMVLFCVCMSVRWINASGMPFMKKQKKIQYFQLERICFLLYKIVTLWYYFCTQFIFSLG